MRFGWVRKLLRSAVLILCGLALATARSEAGEDAVSLPTPAKRPMIGVKPSPGRPDTIIMTFSGKIGAPLADYPSANAALHEFIETHADFLQKFAVRRLFLADLFAIFCHWLTSARFSRSKSPVGSCMSGSSTST